MKVYRQKYFVSFILAYLYLKFELSLRWTELSRTEWHIEAIDRAGHRRIYTRTYNIKHQKFIQSTFLFRKAKLASVSCSSIRVFNVLHALSAHIAQCVIIIYRYHFMSIVSRARLHTNRQFTYTSTDKDKNQKENL